MLCELEGIGDYYRTISHVRKNSFFDIGQLIGKQIRVDVVVVLEVSFFKVGFDQLYMFFVLTSVEDFAISEGDRVDIIALSFESKILRKESERFPVPAPQVDDLCSSFEFQSLFDELEMIIERRYIGSSFVSRKNRSEHEQSQSDASSCDEYD